MSIPSFRIAALTTEFVLDENTAYVRILGEVRSDGGERLYAYGPEGFTVQLAVGGNVEYPLLDGLGSVRQLTDASGTVILSRSYDAYGAVRLATGMGSSRLGYTGELQDSVGGLVYLRARHYHPVLGRFLQRDSFGGYGQRPQSLNRYVYVQNNPIRYTDPSGHDICIACMIPEDWKETAETWGVDNPMAPLYILPVYWGLQGMAYEGTVGWPADPGLEVTVEWYFEMGEQSRTYGPDFGITQALMHDEGVEEARRYFVSHGRQDLLESNETWYEYRFGLDDAIRELLLEAYIGYDWSTSFLGDYNVEVINVESMVIEWSALISLCNDGSLVEIRVHNTTGWLSATRVGDYGSFRPNEERSDPGPGGNLYQTYIWQERIP